jgi:hypothetical protein
MNDAAQRVAPHLRRPRQRAAGLDEIDLQPLRAVADDGAGGATAGGKPW